MKTAAQLKTATPPILITLVLACFGFLPGAGATDLDGVLPGGNNADGFRVLTHLTTGGYNTGSGWFSLFSDQAGSFNTAFGAATLFVNTGDENTATGAAALFSNTTGGDNTATGIRALFSNTTGSFNTANGAGALVSNTGDHNTAIGAAALLLNTTGGNNTAVGTDALDHNDTGSGNTGIGSQALEANTTGNENTAIGTGALFNATGVDNTALGYLAGTGVTTAENVICIGHPGENVSDSCYIGNIYFNVQPVVGTDPDYVTIKSSGRLGRGNVSSRRYKHDIKPMENASEALYALKPASFRYNKEYDATQTLAFGLIAEEVAEVYPDLVGRNPKGEPESVRYEQINAMLLNEFLKEHKTVEDQGRELQEQRTTIGELKTTLAKQAGVIAQQQKAMDILSAQIQAVSAELEVRKSTPRMAGNNP